MWTLYYVRSLKITSCLDFWIVLNAYIARRSLAILTGDARYKYKHGISKDLVETSDSGITIERDKRISFTFREIIAWEVPENTPSCNGSN